jgi:cation diffusion facilitator family transporter
MADGSARVVLIAMGGNLAIAVAKFAAFSLSGSSAMLTEAIHSLIDTADQILLLIGQRRGRLARDRDHPMGHGMETYFWSFIVALMVFLLGGMFGLYQGVRHLLAPEPVTAPWVSLGVLAVSAVFEGSSFVNAFREFRRVVQGRDVRLWGFIRGSKDPGLYATLLEDSAALIGIGLAAAGVIASAFLHIPWADGAASIAISLLLVAVSAVLANETRSLIAGEAVAPAVMEQLKAVLIADGRILEVDEIATLHLGPQAILVALTLRFQPQMSVAALGDAIREITRALQAADGRIAYVYVRPGDGDAPPRDQTEARVQEGLPVTD